jgi:integrase
VRSITLGAWPELPTVYAARDVAKERMAAITSKTDERSTRIATLRDAMESHIEGKKPSAKTATYYREQVDRHLSTLFDRPIESLTLPDLERTLARHMRDGKTTSTQQHLHHIIGMAFKRASVVRRIPNVAEGLDKVKHKPTNNRVKFDVRERWPALDLIRAKDEHNQIIATAFEVMLFTGLRAKNVCELRWTDVDLDARMIRVAQLKNGLVGEFPIAGRVVRVLSLLPRHSEWLFPQHDASKHIYCPPEPLRHDGQVLRPHDCRRLFTTAARRIRLPAYIIDQLRGDTIKSVQDLYDQGSMTHDDAEAIARQIEVECGEAPDSTVVYLTRTR